MGLDIAVGIMIFLGAVRGWFRGFLLQAVRLGGVVGAVYLAAPVRELAKPYVAPYLETIRPDLLDRMLWWGAGVVCYLVMVGVVSTIVHYQRRRPFGDPDVSRADQSAGFLLGSAKAAVVAAFLVASLDKYAVNWVKSVPWADQQARDSMVLAWERQYRPADRIWTAPPVQQFVAYVRKMGMSGGVDLGEPGNAVAELLVPKDNPAATSAEAAAPRNPRLGLPPIGRRSLPPLDATEAEVAEQISQAVERINTP